MTEPYAVHGPKSGCNWNVCGFDDSDNCPFVKDKGGPGGDDKQVFVELAGRVASVNCRHEWRQLVNEHRGFYCVRCLTITTSNAEHGTVIVHNRGESWMD